MEICTNKSVSHSTLDGLGPRTSAFLNRINTMAPAFAKSVFRTAKRHPVVFGELAEPMLGWAEGVLGDASMDILIDGYVTFVIDVNRGQAEYEKRGRYEYSSYSEVFRKAYDNPDFMKSYHWGVYVTTFAWEHHLRIFDFFRSQFLARLSACSQTPCLVDLGSGSGIWSILALRAIPGASSTLVDISATTVALASRLIETTGLADRATMIEGDAIKFKPDATADGGLSCFLLEHVEQPGDLLTNLSNALGDRGYAFITAALTAAETDHIHEFRRESEIVGLAEDSGFRVIATLSSAPEAVDGDAVFLPRSMGLVLQKRRGSIW